MARVTYCPRLLIHDIARDSKQHLDVMKVDRQYANLEHQLVCILKHPWLARV